MGAACLPGIIRGAVCLSVHRWLQARMTDEEDVFRKAADLT